MLVLFGQQSHNILHLSNNYLVTSSLKSRNMEVHKHLLIRVIPHTNNLQLETNNLICTLLGHKMF